MYFLHRLARKHITMIHPSREWGIALCKSRLGSRVYGLWILGDFDPVPVPDSLCPDGDALIELMKRPVQDILHEISMAS